jgi:hypothetical protein
MAREELKWQNIDADDLPAEVKRSFSNKNPAQGMGSRAPTERGSETPRGTLGWGV